MLQRPRHFSSSLNHGIWSSLAVELPQRKATRVYQTAPERASQPLVEASAARTASGFVDCGVCRARTDAAAVMRSDTSA